MISFSNQIEPFFFLGLGGVGGGGGEQDAQIPTKLNKNPKKFTCILLLHFLSDQTEIIIYIYIIAMAQKERGYKRN